MKEKTCCFTGHRKIPKNQIEYVEKQLLKEIEKAIKNGYEIFCVGGALGFDTMAEKAVLAKKEKYPHVKLHLYLPCENQDDGWCEEDVAIYRKIKKMADEIFYASEKKQHGCMHKRNRMLVSVSGYCISYNHRKTGGTAYTVEYAKSQKIKLKNIKNTSNVKK